MTPLLPGLLTVVAYLLGAVPSGYIAGRLVRGIDLRKHGSGNLGATNTFRVLGPKVAAPVMVADVFKGFLPTALFPLWDGTPRWSWTLVYGAAAILGHVYPVYLRFRGGKGVATATGVFLALAPWAVAVGAVAWALVLRFWRMVSLASVVAAVVLVVTLWATEQRVEVRLLGGAVAVFVLYSHRSNLRRIARGEEYRFGPAGRGEPLGREKPS